MFKPTLAPAIYTVRRTPYTAGAKVAAGYSPIDLEYTALSSNDAIQQAIRDCEWQDPGRNFRWRVVGRRQV